MGGSAPPRSATIMLTSNRNCKDYHNTIEAPYDTRSKDKLSIDKVNLELTNKAFFIRGLPFLIIVCSFVPKEATFFLNSL